MPKAIWNGTAIADSASCVEVEGNQYFPPGDVHAEYLRPSDTRTVCSWKGVASYYDVIVDGKINKDAAWYYPDPKPAAAHIQNRIAFWRGVAVS